MLGQYMSELITNGDFSNGTTGWSGNGTSVISVTSEQMTVFRNAGAFADQCYQDIVTEVGVEYTFTADLISQNNTTSIVIDGNEAASWVGAPIVFTATGTTTRVSINASGNSGASSVIDNVSVPGAAASGPTIDTQPQAQSATEGQDATFIVAATTSGGAIAYQ